ncbi:MAG: ERAP1-like C-terminal domain-containing protein, partial [Jatrophihabitantaceae bacterium]
TWTALPAALPAMPRLARVAVWNALRLAIADSEIAPETALGMVEAAIPSETDDALLIEELRWVITTVVGVYLAPPGRARALARVSAACARNLADAAPGSGRQLAALRGMIAAEPDPGRLRAWLGGAVPGGIAVDPDLRWRIVARLSALGDSDTLGAEVSADVSAEGAQHAARCRALLPDPAAKAEAWRLLMSDAGCANSILYATARGFWHPAQGGLTEAYLQRYFDEIPSTARLRSGWVVMRTAALAYPWPMVADSTLALTDDLLARPDLSSGIRRSVIDAGDDLRRAVVSRKRYGLSAEG